MIAITSSVVVNASQWLCIKNQDTLIYYSNCYPGNNPEEWKNNPAAFACVSYNPENNKIIAWRDHFGLEPLYYHFDSRQFIFGSSLPDIIKQLPKHPALNTSRILIECFAKDQVNTPDYSNETFYKGIYRVEPGHCLTIQSGRLHSEAFWQLDPEQPLLHYANDQEYLEHFNELLHESVQVHTQGVTKLAAEFSGGLDSSTLITACHHLGIKPTLFSHIAYSSTEEKDDLTQIQCLLKQFNLNDIHYIDAEEFDPINVFNELLPVFAGSPCYVFFMLANNIHQAVKQGGYTTLLSGFGGDECVSGYARNVSYYPELLRQHSHQQAWQEMACQLQRNSTITPSKIKIFSNLLRYKSPFLFNLLGKISDTKTLLKSYLNDQELKPRIKGYPYYPSVRHFEYSQLQGRLCSHVRMRIEYSAVLGKYFGFQYTYPLLYPKLVEFCFRLPLEQKRRNGQGRYLVRQYLAQYLPETVSAHNSKLGGITPATRHKYKEYLNSGKLDAYFKNLPFEKEISQITATSIQPFAKILAYMIKRYAEINNLEIPSF